MPNCNKTPKRAIMLTTTHIKGVDCLEGHSVKVQVEKRGPLPETTMMVANNQPLCTPTPTTHNCCGFDERKTTLEAHAHNKQHAPKKGIKPKTMHPRIRVLIFWVWLLHILIWAHLSLELSYRFNNDKNLKHDNINIM